MRSNRPGPLLALIIAIGLIFVPATILAAPHPQDTTIQAPDPQAGIDSYAQNCAPCHGETGGGDGASASGLNFPPVAFSDTAAIADLSPAEWFDVTKNGRMERMMPPWSNRLTDQEIWDTVGYAMTLHTSRAQVEMGKAVYEQNCAACHGADGKGNNAPGMVDLSDFALTSQASLAEWAEVAANGKGTMPAFGDKLSEAERSAALEYVRSLSMGPMFRAPLSAGEGVISGTVSNATTGTPMAGLPVTLGVFDGASLVEERSATTDSAGAYRFESLSTDPAATYVARVVYPEGELPYSSEMVTFAEGQATAELPIEVYETTTDPSGLRADRVHYIVDLQPGFAQVAEMVVFSLDGNRAYVGDAGGVLKFTLPPGAQELTVDSGELGADQRFVQTAEGFVDRLPVAPGEQVRQVLYSYTIPYTGGSLTLSRALAYPAAAVNVLASDVGQKMTSPDMTDQGRRTTEMGSFFSFIKENVAANQAVSVQISNLPAAGSAAEPSSSNGALSHALLFGLVGAGAAAAVLLAAWPLLRRERSASPVADAVQDRAELADALARLTIAYEDGEISESAYRDQRLQLKAQLLDAEARAASRSK